ncbi:MAG: flagellar biosynthetic protein FliQ [Lentisphaerae bacterium]|nr:flagellar biosynthetic protein FliQ [Lentisphaerota bacterium]
MTPQMALELTQRALMTAMMLGAPVLITAMVVGVLINIIQTVTSIKDMSLTFVPKAIIAAAVTGFSLPWGIQTMNAYFREMYGMMTQMPP